VHVQFFGEEREHGWVGNKWIMEYKGLAAFEAEAEFNASMKVAPSRLPAWTIAVKEAEEALCLDRLNRIQLLTSMLDPVLQKTTPSPKKRKRPYVPKSVKTPPASGDKVAVDISTASQDDFSPPRKKYRRRSSLPLKQVSDKLIGSEVQSATPECDGPLADVKNIVSSESATGKISLLFTE